MSLDRRRWTRRLSALTLALSLLAACAPGTARAQEPAPPAGMPQEGGDSSGRPLDGYLATACLAGLVLFIVGKSARR